MKCHGPGCTRERSELSEYFCSERCQYNWHQANGQPLCDSAEEVVASAVEAYRQSMGTRAFPDMVITSSNYRQEVEGYVRDLMAEYNRLRQYGE